MLLYSSSSTARLQSGRLASGLCIAVPPPVQHGRKVEEEEEEAAACLAGMAG